MHPVVFFSIFTENTVLGPCYSKALDTETGKWVALKKLARPFQSHVHAKRTYREVKLLKLLTRTNTNVSCKQVVICDPCHLPARDNIPHGLSLTPLQVVDLLEVFTPDTTYDTFKDV